MGHFIFRELMLSVELVVLDKHFKAIYSSFVEPKKHSNMFIWLREHSCLKIEVIGDMCTWVCTQPCSLDAIMHAGQNKSFSSPCSS